LALDRGGGDGRAGRLRRKRAGLAEHLVGYGVRARPPLVLRCRLLVRTAFGPVLPWFYGADFWFERALGPWILGALVTGFGLLLLTPATRRLGPTVQWWSLSRSAYLLLVFAPQSSIFRLLMPLAPLGGMLAAMRTRTIVQLIVASATLQGLWVFCPIRTLHPLLGRPLSLIADRLRGRGGSR